MIIGIDARTIFTKEITGVGNYVLRLVQFLQKKGYSPVLFTDSLDHLPDTIDRKKVIIAYGKSSNRYVWEQIALWRLLQKYPVDIYHAAWNHGIPILYRRKTMLTVYDIIPIILKNLYTSTLKDKVFNALYRISLFVSIIKASHIITISHSSENDILRFFSASRDKLSSEYVGLSLPPSVLSDSGPLKKYFGITKKYIVYFGGFEQRKNIIRLIKAFYLVKKKHDIQFVLIGGENQYYSDNLARYCNETTDIIFTDFLENAEMFAIAQTAETMIYPSLYEGFGLPPLEAMSVGCPVISSATSSLSEVCGDAAIFIDPENIEDIADKISVLIQSPEKQEILRTLGFKNIARFSWEKHMVRVLKLYHEIKSV